MPMSMYMSAVSRQKGILSLVLEVILCTLCRPLEQARTGVNLLEDGDPCISRARSRAHVECESENGRALGLLGKPKGDGETSSRLSRSCGGRPTAGKAWVALSDPLILSVFIFVAAFVASLAIAVEIARGA